MFYIFTPHMKCMYLISRNADQHNVGIWKVHTSSCHSLIDEVMKESSSLQHVTHLLMCGIFYLSGIDTGTRDYQVNVSSEQHPAGILLMYM